MTHFKIQIVSDTVCPWCYIGSKRLVKGIAAYQEAHPGSHDTFSTTWKPFYLNPESPKESVDKRALYAAKFGEARAKAAFERLSALGKVEGINFKFGGKTGNTRDSHRLIQLGKTKNADTQNRVVHELFHAYFEKEQDITAHPVLLEAGVKAGLEAGEVQDWLNSERGGPDVDAEVRQAQRKHITGVPHFIIQDTHEIGGAQDPATFQQVFEKIRASSPA
ncbi:MAG: hypothetical protein M1838_000964 [Thelocarpon superellum]|nr:MAG: hypothetical protein M1838_000964 [Thelocarpon superellum]